MENFVEKKLSLDYDVANQQLASYVHVCKISEGSLDGAVLFSGSVIARDNIIHPLQGDYLLVSNARHDNLVSLYMSPLEQRFKDEGMCLKDIQPTDRRYVINIFKGTFMLVVEDARKNRVATFEFWYKGDMLYVPKRQNTHPLDNPLDKY